MCGGHGKPPLTLRPRLQRCFRAQCDSSGQRACLVIAELSGECVACGVRRLVRWLVLNFGICERRVSTSPASCSPGASGFRFGDRRGNLKECGKMTQSLGAHCNLALFKFLKTMVILFRRFSLWEDSTPIADARGQLSTARIQTNMLRGNSSFTHSLTHSLTRVGLRNSFAPC